jgi:hypothetical protein
LWLAVVVVVAGAGAPVVDARGPVTRQRAVADFWTKQTPPLASGQIEVITLSTPPSVVSGGDVLVGVRGLSSGDTLTVKRNGADVTPAFALDKASGEYRGLLTGLREGRNRIAATARAGRGKPRTATLLVRNHPVGGPIISGPHQQPFYCETQQAGLGKPTDADCNAPTKREWFYRSNGGAYHPLGDPQAAYPGDIMNTTLADGRVVPFVVRVESSTINRGISRIAVLDDPHGQATAAKPFTPNWTGRLTYAFGESCGVGYHQGRNTSDQSLGGLPAQIGGDSIFSTVYGLTDRLAAGDMVALSTQTTFGVYCNPMTSAETLMMVKEHISERYGLIRRTVSVGGSGGALQQYSTANSFPGLLDAAIPIATFADIPSTAMTVVDCGLLHGYWNSTSMDWTESQKAIVAGHLNANICRDWINFFLPDLDPTEGCSGIVPRATRYDAVKNPKGVRCSLQDATVNIWGRDRKTGFARRPFDNVGVQYGLLPLNRGEITLAQFIDMNRNVGGFNIDGRRESQRSAMDPETARAVYRIGGVIGRGALAQIPIIDMATYLDAVPSADIHDIVRPFEIRDRLAQRGHEANQSIWRGVVLPTEAEPVIDKWLDNLAKSKLSDRAAAVAASKPAEAMDRCAIGGGTMLNVPGGLTLPFGLGVAVLPMESGIAVPLRIDLPEHQSADSGACQQAFPAKSGTRIQAGGPFSDDTLKCRLKPVGRADYKAPVTEADLAQLRQIFPGGVCDYSKPAVGDVKQSLLWPSLGGKKLAGAYGIKWLTARSR